MLVEFEITWVDPALVLCQTSGLASVEDYRAMMRALTSDPRFGPDTDLIVDHTNVDISALTPVEIEQVASFRVEFTGATAGRSATVVGPNSSLRYGLGRMFETYVESLGGKVELFTTLDQAMVWLRGADLPIPRELPSDDGQAPPREDR